MNAKNLKTITSDDLIATNSESAFVGAIVYWRLTGNIQPEQLKAAWATAGLDADLLPKLPSPTVSMTRAVDEIAKRGRLKTRVKNGGYALLDKREKDGLSIDVNCRIYLDAKNDLRIAEQVPYGDTKVWQDCTTHPLLQQLLASFESHKGSYESRDITSWLCNEVMTELGATTLRKDGGVYFVPRDAVAMLQKIVEVLQTVSNHKVYQVKAMTGEEAVEAVLDAIVAEAMAAAEVVEKALAQGHGENEGEESSVKPLGPRGLESRANDCRTMIEKVRKYEVLLGKKMPEITERLEDLKVASMEASLAAKAASTAKAPHPSLGVVAPVD